MVAIPFGVCYAEDKCLFSQVQSEFISELLGRGNSPQKLQFPPKTMSNLGKQN